MGRAFADVASHRSSRSGSDVGNAVKFCFDIRASINENVALPPACRTAHFPGLFVFYRARFLF